MHDIEIYRHIEIRMYCTQFHNNCKYVEQKFKFILVPIKVTSLVITILHCSVDKLTDGNWNYARYKQFKAKFMNVYLKILPECTTYAIR